MVAVIIGWILIGFVIFLFLYKSERMKFEEQYWKDYYDDGEDLFNEELAKKNKYRDEKKKHLSK